LTAHSLTEGITPTPASIIKAKLSGNKTAKHSFYDDESEEYSTSENELDIVNAAGENIAQEWEVGDTLG